MRPHIFNLEHFLQLCSKSPHVRKFVPVVVVAQHKAPCSQFCTFWRNYAPCLTRAEYGTLFRSCAPQAHTCVTLYHI